MGGLTLAEGMVCVPFDVDVSDVVPFPGPHILRGWVQAPTGLDPEVEHHVFFCLAGGKCSTGYFDLRPDGIDGYSMAAHLVEHGQIVVAFDHLGIGASSGVEDIMRVTPWVAAAANDKAHRYVLEALRSGTVTPDILPLDSTVAIGVGHSMGGMLLCIEQANFAFFDAIATFGHGGDGLPGFLTEDELHWTPDLPDAEGRLVELTRIRADAEPQTSHRLLPGSFLPRDLPDSVRAAFVKQQTDLLLTCGLMSMIPGGTDREKSSVTTPVFLALGDHDLTKDLTGSVAHYSASPDITLYVLYDSPHCHNQAHTRVELWNRLLGWACSL
jgi:pimeloyl-ACP methyl ester carboxylesterase